MDIKNLNKGYYNVFNVKEVILYINTEWNGKVLLNMLLCWCVCVCVWLDSPPYAHLLARQGRHMRAFLNHYLAHFLQNFFTYSFFLYF